MEKNKVNVGKKMLKTCNSIISDYKNGADYISEKQYQNVKKLRRKLIEQKRK